MAVRLRELGATGDLDLSRLGKAYRSALIVVTANGRPVGEVAFSLDDSARIDEARLRDALSRFAPAAEPEGPAPVARPGPTVSVVVTTCDNPRSAIRTVSSILSCHQAPAEVIVVENRPRDSTVAAALAQHFGPGSGVRYVEEDRPGLAVARNAGLAAARSEVVAFTDDDVVVDVNWVSRLAAAFNDEAMAGCITGLILPADLETDVQLRIEQFAGYGKGYRRRVYRLGEPTSPLFPFAAGEFGSGASTALRVDVARELGGFDPALGTGTPARGGEDLDIFIRVLLSGHALIYEPAAMLWHEHPARTAGLRRRVYGYGVSLSAVMAKYLLAGHAPAMLARLPAAWHFIRDPRSRKNVGKPADFPAWLEWIERLGMGVGPLAYLASRRRVPSAERVGAIPPYRPTWVGEIEVKDPVQDLVVPRGPDGIAYGRARLLAWIDGAPLAFVDVPVAGGRVSGSELTTEFARLGLRDRRQGPPDATVHAERRIVSAEPPISVVVCTRDRPASLPAALCSVLAVAYDNFEVLVVDNAPTGEGARELVMALADPRLRYVTEPAPGLSRARNRGAAEARYGIIAFTDDDVRVDPGWLAAIAHGFTRGSAVGCVTGLATASELDTAAQAYFETRVKWADNLASRLFDLEHPGSSRFFPYTVGEVGAGANFAVLRSALAAIGPFDEALGAGTTARGGEDLDFFLRLILSGYTIAFEPAAVVWHTHRRDAEALRRQMVGYGSGLSAYALKHLLRAQTWARLIGGLRAPVDDEGPAGFRPVASPTPGLRSAELRGLLSGPAAYLMGRRHARKLPPIVTPASSAGPPAPVLSP